MPWARLTRGGRVAPALLLPQAPAVFVECTLGEREPLLRVDHHNPGDPGYAMPPERYVEGSSLGQTLTLLEMEPSATQRLLAAADHCLTAAYQGRCPGVDPDELLFLRASWRAKTSGRSLTDVIDGILAAAKAVRRFYDSEYDESLFSRSDRHAARPSRPTCRPTFRRPGRTWGDRCATARSFRTAI